MNRLTKECLAETIGTFMLVFIGCGTIMAGERFSFAFTTLSIPFSFGLTVMAVAYTIGHISGAHLNPSVTLALSIVKKFPSNKILPYFIAQFLGGFLAILILDFILPKGTSYGATLPSLDPLGATIIETLITFFLMFVIMGSATDKKAHNTMAGAAIGITITLCILFAGPLTGASMNPARSLAPIIFEGKIEVLWIYFVGPFLGAIMAALIYECIKEKE